MPVHPGVDENQLAGLNPSPNLMVRLPRAEHLATGDDAVLLADQVVKRHIDFLSHAVKGKPRDRP